MKLMLVVMFLTSLTCVLTNRVQNRAEKRAQEKAQKKSPNKEYAVNEGASTSRGPECELDEIAESALEFMLARNENYDGDLKKMVKERIHEVIVTYKEFQKLMNRISPGSQFQNDRTAPYFEAREREYERRLEMKIAEKFLECTRSKYYKLDRRYQVDVLNQTLDFLPPKISKNLCETDIAKKELEIFEKDLRKSQMPKDKVKFKKGSRPRKLIAPDPGNSNSPADNNPKIADHHIIKQSLIDEFMNIPTDRDQFDITSVAQIRNKNWKVLTIRMRNHFKVISIGRFAIEKKKLLRELNLTNCVDLERLVDDDYLNEMKRRSDFWSHRGSNIFRGPLPSLRGPFDPFLWDDRYVFEEDSEPIIGKEHARYSRWVSENLKKFVEQHHEMDYNTKYTKKNLLMDQLNYAMGHWSLTPYNPDQWELVVPTESDLDRLKIQKSRKTFRNKKFWKIKQPKPESVTESTPEHNTSERSKRSVIEGENDSGIDSLTYGENDSETESEHGTDNENKIKSDNIDKIVRLRWRDFVLVSLRDQSEAYSSNQSFEWSHDLNNLYDQYESGNWTNVLCAGSKNGFDRFLYSRMFFQDKWTECIVNNKSIDKELCSALRRIILNTGSDNEILWPEESRSQQLLKDRTTVWKKLNQIPAVNHVPKMTVMVEEKVNNNEAVDIYVYNNVINAGSIILPLIGYNFCNKNILTRAKRDSNNFDKIYNREWILGTDGNLNCL